MFFFCLFVEFSCLLGRQKDKAPEPNRNKLSVLDALLLGSLQNPKRRSLTTASALVFTMQASMMQSSMMQASTVI